MTLPMARMTVGSGAAISYGAAMACNKRLWQCQGKVMSHVMVHPMVCTFIGRHCCSLIARLQSIAIHSMTPQAVGYLLMQAHGTCKLLDVA